MEMIDMSESGNYQCLKWIDYPIAVAGASGGLLGTNAIVCGGDSINTQGLGSITDDCYKITATEAVHLGNMTTKRNRAASLPISNTALWITGGYDDDDYIQLSSDLFDLDDGIMQGPELPIAIYGHAMIKIKNYISMVIGGDTGQVKSAQTFIYNHYYGNWTNGPELNQARYQHAAGIVSDEATLQKLPIVTGGSVLKSTEILINGTWSLGKERFG